MFLAQFESVRPLLNQYSNDMIGRLSQAGDSFLFSLQFSESEVKDFFDSEHGYYEERECGILPSFLCAESQKQAVSGVVDDAGREIAQSEQVECEATISWLIRSASDFEIFFDEIQRVRQSLSILLGLGQSLSGQTRVGAQ